MSATFLCIVNVILLGRIAAFSADKPTTLLRLCLSTVAQFALVLVVFDAHPRHLVTAVIVGPALMLAVTERFRSSRAESWWNSARVIARLAVLLLTLAALGYVWSRAPLSPRPWLHAATGWLGANVAFGRALVDAPWPQLLAYGDGLLLCTDETNMVLRALFHAIKLRPPRGLKNFKRGAQIGNLERVLIYAFVVNGAFGAVGFIIAAKGLVRFHELTEADAAEYVLIGTLASTVIAICFALLAVRVANGIP